MVNGLDHIQPFIWNHIESEKGKFFWEDADQYVVYAQEHNQTILATIWPHEIGIKNLAKEKRKSLLVNVLQNI